MGQTYQEIKELRSESKGRVIAELVIKKGSKVGGAVVVQAAGKKRGRPAKKAKEAAVLLTDYAVPADKQAPKKKRGRPKGSKNKKTLQLEAKQVSETVVEEVRTPKKRGRKKGNPNEKEISVMQCLNGGGRGRFKALTIREIGETCFPDEDKSTRGLWVRTSLRRPVNEKWVENAGRGEYRMTLEGRTALKGLVS